MATIPDAAADRNVMAELNNTISGFAPIIASKISEEAKSNTTKAVENEIAQVVQSIEEEVGRAVEDTNFIFNNYAEEVGKLAQDIVEDEVDELKAKDVELKAKDQQSQAKDEQLEQLKNTSTTEQVARLVEEANNLKYGLKELARLKDEEANKLKDELKELVGTEKLTPKEWLFFSSKMIIELYVSVAEPLAAIS